jgi:hypothetical protein
MGAGASAEALSASTALLDALECDGGDDAATAALIRSDKRFDPRFKTSIMHHEEGGWTLLHVACSERVRGEHPLSAKALISRGCRVNAHTPVGNSCFTMVHNSRPYGYANWTPLMFAARNGRTETMKVLLKAKAKINSRANDGGNALHIAAAHLQTEAARLLIASGVDTQQRSGIVRQMSEAFPEGPPEGGAPGAAPAPQGGRPTTASSVGSVVEFVDRPLTAGSSSTRPFTAESRPGTGRSSLRTPGAQVARQYGVGLTPLDVVCGVEENATEAQDEVEYSLVGFAVLGQIKDEMDVAASLRKLLSEVPGAESPLERHAERRPQVAPPGGGIEEVERPMTAGSVEFAPRPSTAENFPLAASPTLSLEQRPAARAKGVAV